MFRRFEFRNLIGRVDQLDEAVPALPTMRPEGTSVAWREGELPETRDRASLAVDDGRFALALDDGVVLGEFDADVAQARLRDAHVIAHDFKSLPRLTMTPAEDTMLAAYLIDPGRPAYELDDLAQEYGLEVLPEPATDEETRDARAPRRGGAPARARCSASGSASAGARCSTTTSSSRSPRCSPRWRTRGSRSTRTAWARSRRGSPTASRSSRRRRTSSPARSSCSARRSRSRASSSRSSSSLRGARARPATPPTRACCARSAATTRSSR